jgi:glycosyltransferase involved in cell wall biosynthesis
MKVLFIIGSLSGGGAERVLCMLANELIERGYEVCIATNTDIPIAYHFNKGIILKNIYPTERKKYDGIPLFSKPYKMHVLFNSIRKTALQERPDVVIPFMTEMNLYVLISLIGTHFRIIASEHTIINLGKNENSLLKVITRRFAYHFVDKVTVLTEYDKRSTSKLLKNVVVMPNPLSFKPLSIEEFIETDIYRKNILACGNISRYQIKGFDSLILAFAKIAKSCPNWTLDIAGGGNQESFAYLKELAIKNGVENQVHLLGFCKNINTVMKEHKVFVLSSRYEGFGMALTEAMAMGCACISYNCIAGPGEIIQDGTDGILVEDQNIDELADKMLLLINNDDKRKELAKNAISSVKRFDIKEIADKWCNLINSI